MADHFTFNALVSWTSKRSMQPPPPSVNSNVSYSNMKNPSQSGFPLVHSPSVTPSKLIAPSSTSAASLSPTFTVSKSTSQLLLLSDKTDTQKRWGNSISSMRLGLSLLCGLSWGRGWMKSRLGRLRLWVQVIRMHCCSRFQRKICPRSLGVCVNVILMEGVQWAMRGRGMYRVEHKVAKHIY